MDSPGDMILQYAWVASLTPIQRRILLEALRAWQAEQTPATEAYSAAQGMLRAILSSPYRKPQNDA